MKLIYTVLLSFFMASSYGQKWERNEKDEFTGNLVQETKYERVHQGFSYTIRMKMLHVEDSDFEGNYLYVEYTHNNLSVCKNKETNIIFKFIGEETLLIKPDDNIDCGNFITIRYPLKQDDLEVLKSSQIEKFRIYYTDGYIDYKMKKTDYFQRTISFMNF